MNVVVNEDRAKVMSECSVKERLSIDEREKVGDDGGEEEKEVERIGKLKDVKRWRRMCHRLSYFRLRTPR